MHATAQLPPLVSEPLTWAEICEQYPDQHVCLVQPERNDPFDVHFLHARVAGHGTSINEAFARAGAAWDFYGLLEHRFTGRAPRPLLLPRIIVDDEL